MTYRERANKVLVDGTGTLSKKPSAFVDGVYDTHIQAYSPGSTHVVTASGDRLTDWISALGANLWGSGHSFSLPNIIEVEAAEAFVDRFPCDVVKFLKTGSEACAAAIRYARAYTGRKRVIGHGYHGWNNAFVHQEVPGVGCIDEEYRKYDTLDELQNAIRPGVAAVILEPIQLDLSVRDQIVAIRRSCLDNEILFVADEVVTGGRVPQWSVSRWWDLHPDIICAGKGLGMGHSMGIVGGKRDVMTTPGVFVSTTFSGEIDGLSGLIDCLRHTDEDIERIWRYGLLLMIQVNDALSKLDVCLKGYPTRLTWDGPEENVAWVWQELYRRGHLVGKAFFLSWLHTEEDMHSLVEACRDIGSKPMGKLLGLPPQAPFQRFR